MSKSGSPMAIDNWLYLLSLLSATSDIKAKYLFNKRGNLYQSQPLCLLKAVGLIQYSKAGYRLSRPLKDISFSELVNCWSVSKSSYIRRLFMRYGHLSVAEINRLPPVALNRSPTSLEGVCHVIRELKYKELTVARHLSMAHCVRGYCSTIVRDLVRFQLAYSDYPNGSALLKRHDEILIKDIIPIVSNKCEVLGKLLEVSKDLPITCLYK